MTKLRNMYAQELGFVNEPALKRNYDNKEDSRAKDIEGLILAHIFKALSAVEKFNAERNLEMIDILEEYIVLFLKETNGMTEDEARTKVEEIKERQERESGNA